ncbi:MAG TPA: hypothetical protein DCQ98_16955 [Planctomycetaceae bacterium]|nr:hypothetical protein [Planctomycetaceae bacterium]
MAFAVSGAKGNARSRFVRLRKGDAATRRRDASLDDLGFSRPIKNPTVPRRRTSSCRRQTEDADHVLAPNTAPIVFGAAENPQDIRGRIRCSSSP